LRLEASLVGNDVLADENVRVIPQTRRSFLEGFALYEAHPDKGYSLTDCISMQTMRHSGFTDVLTNDRHFEQEGFRALSEFLLTFKVAPASRGLAFGPPTVSVEIRGPSAARRLTFLP
jgi:hypothetical protein